MTVLGDPGSRSFIDVGCSVGTKLHLARMLGWTYVAGFDSHQPYVFAARELCPWATVWTGEARACWTYDQFDVVYSYRLCVEDDDQRDLEQMIVSRMRPGALAFFPQGLTEPGRSLGSAVWEII